MQKVSLKFKEHYYKSVDGLKVFLSIRFTALLVAFLEERLTGIDFFKIHLSWTLARVINANKNRNKRKDSSPAVKQRAHSPWLYWPGLVKDAISELRHNITPAASPWGHQARDQVPGLPQHRQDKAQALPSPPRCPSPGDNRGSEPMKHTLTCHCQHISSASGKAASSRTTRALPQCYGRSNGYCQGSSCYWALNTGYEQSHSSAAGI